MSLVRRNANSLRTVAESAANYAMKVAASQGGRYVRKKVAGFAQDSINRAMSSIRKRRANSANVGRKRAKGKPGPPEDFERNARVVSKGKPKSTRAKPAGKKLKLTPKFKRAVKQVMAKAAVRGHYEWLGPQLMQKFNASTSGGSGLQTVGMINAFNGLETSPLCSPLTVLHACSRLYNGKVASATATQPASNDTGNFPLPGFVVNVINHFSKIRIRSQSNRTYFYTFYVVQPNVLQNRDAPISAWEDALTHEGTYELVASRNNGFTPSIPTISKIYQKPTDSTQWKKLFRVIETKSIRLEPGEYAEFNVSHPTGEMKFDKFFQESTYNTVNNKCQYLMYAVHTDLVINDATPSVAMRTNEASNRAVLFETHYNIDFVLPEQAGFVYGGIPGAGQTQALNLRIKRRAYDHYYALSTNGTSLTSQALDTKVRIDPIMPQDPDAVV